MNSVIDTLESLEIPGRLAKEKILVENHSQLLIDVFKAALDPYVDYGVKKFKKPLPAQSCQLADDENLTLFLALLNKLSKRELTGNNAREHINRHFQISSELQQKWCERILLKRLRVGVQLSTVNKLWPSTVSTFKVALAETLKATYKPDLGKITVDDALSYPVFVEPKLDGLRLIAIKENGVVTLHTRNGNIVDTLSTIKGLLESASYDNVVIDGEAMGSDWNESTSIMMSHKHHKSDETLVFYAFDAVTIDEWRSHNGQAPFKHRKRLLQSIVDHIGCEQVRSVDGSIVVNEDELMSEYKRSLDNKYEGVMIKDPEAPYQFKRSDSILKMKPTMTFEGTIVDTFKGRTGTRLEDAFGGIKVLLKNGVVTRVGSGFSDAQRKEFAEDNELVGKIVELEGQPDPETSDGLSRDGRIRFPVFVRFRDQRDVDQAIHLAAVAYFGNVS